MSKGRATAIAVWLAVLVLSGWWIAFKTSVATDLTAFLPRAQTPTEQLLLDELRTGPAARIVMIGIQGADPQQLAALSNGLAQRLRAAPGFARVANGAQLLAPEEQSMLFAHRYLLSPSVSARRFSAAGLEQALQQRLRELASPLSSVEKESIPADPTAEFRSLLQSWRDARAPAIRHGVWFQRDVERALLLVETNASVYDIDAQARALKTIRSAFAQVRGESHAQLLLAGPGLYAVTSRDVTRHETQLLSAAASVAVALILLFAYRNLAVVLLAALPLASGLLVATAAVSAWFGGIHGLTLAFGTTLLGIAVDYPIHLFSHLQAGTRVAAAMRRIWPTMGLGVLTTTLGFGALIGAGFTGLAQLGLFAVCGLLTAAAVTRWLLPALLPATWHPPQAGSSRLLDLAQRVRGRLGLVPAAILAAALLAVLTPGPFPWEDDLAALSPIPDSARRLDHELRRALGAPEVSQAVVIGAPDPQTALRRTEQAARGLDALVSRGALQGFTPASRYLPSAETQRARQRQLPSAAALETSLSHATSQLPFRSGTFAPFLAAVAAARQQAPLTLEQLHHTNLGARIASQLFAGASGWTSVIPLAGVRDPEALENWAQQAGGDVHYLNQRLVARELMTRFRQEGLSRAAWSAAVIVAVLALALRSLPVVARVLFPMLLAGLVDLGSLWAMGQHISLFHLVALLMVLGAGVDYSLFFNRAGGDRNERRRTLHALLVCATSTVAVFGILAWSEIPVLRAIGSTVAIGVSASFVFALLLARRRSPADVR